MRIRGGSTTQCVYLKGTALGALRPITVCEVDGFSLCGPEPLNFFCADLSSDYRFPWCLGINQEQCNQAWERTCSCSASSPTTSSWCVVCVSSCISSAALCERYARHLPNASAACLAPSRTSDWSTLRLELCLWRATSIQPPTTCASVVRRTHCRCRCSALLVVAWTRAK